MDAEISHTLLKEQIKHHLGDADLENSRVREFLIAVDRAYHESDALRDRLRRSVSLSLERLLVLTGGELTRARALELENEIQQAKALLSEGLTFNLDAAAGPARPEGPRRVPTVLCVENEPGLRNLIVRVLSTRGYRVLDSCHAAGAVELAEAHSGAIDLLLCETLLPGTTGASLYARLRPHLRGRVVYLLPGGVREAAVESDTLFLRKPFSIEELADKVQEGLFGE